MLCPSNSFPSLLAWASQPDNMYAVLYVIVVVLFHVQFTHESIFVIQECMNIWKSFSCTESVNHFAENMISGRAGRPAKWVNFHYTNRILKYTKLCMFKESRIFDSCKRKRLLLLKWEWSSISGETRLKREIEMKNLMIVSLLWTDEDNIVTSTPCIVNIYKRLYKNTPPFVFFIHIRFYNEKIGAQKNHQKFRSLCYGVTETVCNIHIIHVPISTSFFYIYLYMRVWNVASAFKNTRSLTSLV